MKESEASLKQAEEITGGQLEYYNVNNVPEKFKKASYPTPFMTPENPDAEDDAEIDETLDSIRQAEVMFGYKKETNGTTTPISESLINRLLMMLLNTLLIKVKVQKLEAGGRD
jgi:hypothetical protein